MKWIFIILVFTALTLFALPKKEDVQIKQSQIHLFKDGKKLIFPDIVTAQKDIINDGFDPYFSKLSLIDLSIRMKKKLKDNVAKERENFKVHCQKAVIPWTEKETIFVTEIFNKIHEIAQSIQPKIFPDELKIIKTNGSEESHLYYTRRNCIIVPQKKLKKMKYKGYFFLFMKTMIHELFHVYSRLNPDMKAKLYKEIGFVKKGEIDLPAPLKKLRLSNPDGNDYSYQIKVKTQENREISVIPVIITKYDDIYNNDYYLFNYVDLAFFEVRLNEEKYSVVTDDNSKSKAYKAEELKGFYEQIGRNTKYIIHPDEILADNVSILFRTRGLNRVYIKNKEGVDLLKRIEKVLKSQ